MSQYFSKQVFNQTIRRANRITLVPRPDAKPTRLSSILETKRKTGAFVAGETSSGFI